MRIGGSSASSGNSKNLRARPRRDTAETGGGRARSHGHRGLLARLCFAKEQRNTDTCEALRNLSIGPAKGRCMRRLPIGANLCNAKEETVSWRPPGHPDDNRNCISRTCRVARDRCDAHSRCITVGDTPFKTGLPPSHDRQITKYNGVDQLHRAMATLRRRSLRSARTGVVPQ